MSQPVKMARCDYCKRVVGDYTRENGWYHLTLGYLSVVAHLNEYVIHSASEPYTFDFCSIDCLTNYFKEQEQWFNRSKEDDNVFTS
ncbi:hypothetical protein J7M07_04375 [bacterium]|nr:hypothetical protein [bacterium]